MIGPKDYLGVTDGRQGRTFVQWNRLGHTILQPLTFLHGQKWDESALAYVHALRPSHLRVVKDGTQLDAQTWRVTVWLENDGETICRIDQEVMVGLSGE